MTHTREGSLRDATAGTVAVLPDPAGFARMRGYRSFRFGDYQGYLRRLERHLRALSRSGGYTQVALFDPEEYADYCGRLGLDPDRAESRSRYTGQVAAVGATVPYRGQRLEVLFPELLAEHERMVAWERGAALLAEAGPCPDCGRPGADCGFRRALATVAEIAARPSGGGHHLVVSVVTDDGPLTAALLVEPGESAEAASARPEALPFGTVLAVALATARPGGLVLRTAAAAPSAGGRASVRGWRLNDGVLEPLTEAEVFSAYCTEPGTGDPVPPEPGVRHEAAGPLAAHRCTGS